METQRSIMGRGMGVDLPPQEGPSLNGKVHIPFERGW